MHSTKLTLNIILLFFAAVAVLLFSYGVTSPDAQTAGTQELREQFNRPALRLPISQATAKSVLKYLDRNDGVGEPNITAAAALVADVAGWTTFFTKNTKEARPIASITKLISAAVVLDWVLLEEGVEISLSAIETEGDAGNLLTSEVLSVEALLHAALLESSNDAIVALAEHIGGVEHFVSLMNEKMSELGLADSHFTDPAGLEDKNSFSSVQDLVNFVTYLRQDPKYDIIWTILRKEKAVFASQNLGIIHTFENNNELISQLPGVIGGKTGYTELAGGSLVLLTKSPDDTGEIIYVILGSQDRFADMRTLINWVNSAYLWKK